ncbi:MAG TPA: hypothetical protein VH520_08530 [Streptosporangiaceae bacterium]
MPTTTWMKLAHRLGRGPNPLRRRSDVLEAWLVPAAIVVFLVLSPLVAGLAALGVRADNAAAQHVQQSWQPVSAVLLRAAPGPEFSDNGGNTWTVWVPARWTVGGHHYTGNIPVAADSRAGSTQTVWLDRAGHVRAPAMTASELSGSIGTGILLAVAALAVVIAIATRLARWLLERRRIASWETAWLSVGPRWSHQV